MFQKTSEDKKKKEKKSDPYIFIKVHYRNN